MKKMALVMLVLALAIPAMADVEITTTCDTNIVTIGYNCTAGETVRAFGLDIVVTGGAYVVGSDVPDANDYYVYPTNMTFTVVEGNTVIDQLGSPIAAADANGGVLEMASLYAANDPCHPTAPPSSGMLVSFAVDMSGSGDITITITENAKRGGVVLEDPDVAATVVLPAPFICGGHLYCYDCPGHAQGDATCDGRVNVLDLVALKKGWGTNRDTSPHGEGLGEYNCCADANDDGRINVLDLVRIKMNWGALYLGSMLPKPGCP